jgi:hypothetical protein
MPQDWKEYHGIYGDCKVPQSSVDEELTPLGRVELGKWGFLNGLFTRRGKLSLIVT